MATMSIGKAWEQAVAFVAREATLLFPVALLFVALPGLIIQEMTPPELAKWSLAPTAAMPNVPPGFILAMLLAIIIVWFGSLTLFALALRPGISVGEALRLSLARLPVLLGTALVIVGALTIAAFVGALVIALLSSLLGPAVMLLASVLVIVAAGFVLFVSVRLVLLNPVVIDGALGVKASLRHSWALTQGHFWRLLGFLLVLTMLSAIVGAAAQSIIGLIAGLVGGAASAQFAGGVAAAIVSTVVQVYMLVMLARLYRQAEGG
ncbi:MAG: glycerophosphoryl diester phosphodiesterase membrane domain-containing protein [bacterium]|nr:glycerophosphoryl diester phosphodiesterase membrane domain-containing protein [bacterium]